MNVEAAGTSGFPHRVRKLLFFQPESGGPSVACWAAIALLNFITQIIFCRNFAPGEFGTLNTALGIVGLMSVPLLALDQAFACYLEQAHAPDRRERIESLRAAMLPVIEMAAWTWGAVSLSLLILVLEPLLHLPRFLNLFFTLLVLFLTLAGVVSAAICRSGSSRSWGWLLLAAAGVRVLVGGVLAGREPWSESGVATFAIAGLVLLYPVLSRPEKGTVSFGPAWASLRDHDFLLYLGATFSVVLGIFLFSSADRLIAQSWFGIVNDTNLGMVDWGAFDAYQAAGLLGRSILWGTQPLLWVLFAQRARLSKTTAASLTFFWIYLGALVLGITLLIMANLPLSRLFCGDNFELCAHLVPAFAVAMLPLGLLQALGMFALASRRFHECFVLGGCAIGYTLVLYLAGRQPDLMTAYMFGAGLVALMIVVLVGVVRWGRKQP